MAAPTSNITWSGVYSTTQWFEYKIGVYTDVSSTDTQTTIKTQVWIASNYRIDDGDINVFYRAGEGVTSITDSEDYKVTSTLNFKGDDNTGTWANQVLAYEETLTYLRSTSPKTIGVYAATGGIYNYTTAVGGLINVGRSVTVPALPTYTITYNANYGTGAPAAQTKIHGTGLKLHSTVPKRTGYTFQYWDGVNTETGAKVAHYNPGDTCSANENLTLYAIWEINKVYITYYTNGGSLSSSVYTTNQYGHILDQSGNLYFSSIDYGKSDDPYNVSTFGLTRTGYHFTGWKVRSTGKILDQDTYYESTEYVQHNDKNKTTANTTNVYCYLDAQWEANEYTVTYNGNGGTYNGSETWVDPTKAVYERSYYIHSNNNFFVRPGYTFAGWNEKADGSGVDWTADMGTHWTWYYTKSVTLYAQWKANVLTINYYTNLNNVTVGEYSSDAGSTVVGTYPNSTKIFSAGRAYNKDYPAGLNNLPLTAMGYEFNGNWGTAPDGGNIINHDTPFASGEAFANVLGKSLVSSNATVDLYAQWEPLNILNIRYNNEWKKGMCWIRYNGEWRKGIIHTYVKEKHKWYKSI